MNSRITIKDIARELNVHHSTVSRALRDDPRVKPETKQLIKKYAEDHGYQINISALHLRGSVRNVLAVLVPNINHQFFSNIISHFTNLANEDGYVVSIFQSNESLQQEKEIIDSIIQNNVAGVIASVSMETTEGQHFMKLKKYNIPLVFFDRVCESINMSKVEVNNYEIVTEAVELLVSKGYKKIAHISGTPTINVFRSRQNGYSYAVNNRNLAYRKTIQINKGFSYEDGFKAATELFSGKDRPDAIICDSHNLFMGVAKKLDELNVRIPKEVGIITFGENETMDFFNPGITTIEQPYWEVSEKAYELLIKKMNDDNANVTESYVVSAKIIQRESC